MKVTLGNVKNDIHYAIESSLTIRVSTNPKFSFQIRFNILLWLHNWYVVIVNCIHIKRLTLYIFLFACCLLWHCKIVTVYFWHSRRSKIHVRRLMTICNVKKTRGKKNAARVISTGENTKKKKKVKVSRQFSVNMLMLDVDVNGW